MVLTRYVIQTSKFSPSKQLIKTSGFMPMWDSRIQAYALSTFVIDGLSDAEIWDMGYQLFKNKLPKARGDMHVTSYEAVGFRADRDDTPPRHVSIIGWPDDRPGQLSKAQELSEKFRETGRLYVPQSRDV